MSHEGDETPTPQTADPPHDHHVLVDAEEDDWAWRRRIRSNPVLAGPYRVMVFVIGLILVLGGLALVPLPGPGWLIVIFGVAVWASEFVFAQAVLHWLKRQLDRWTSWMSAQALWLKGLVAVLSFVFVLGVLWVTLKLSGIPPIVPDAIEDLLRTYAYL